MRYLKIIGWILIGYILCAISQLPQNKVVATKDSPNGKYCAEYKYGTSGVLIKDEYRYYVKVYRKKPWELLFIHHVQGLDYNDGKPSDIEWIGDTLVVKGSDFYTNIDNTLKSIEITDNKTTFCFANGFATK